MPSEDWPPAYGRLAEQFDLMIERTEQRSRRARARRLSVIGGCVVLVGCGAGGAALVIGHGPPAQSISGIPAPETAVSRAVVGTPIADPLGGPPWAVRAYRASSGKTCVAAGRIVRGRFGIVEQGRFQPLATAVREVCVSVLLGRSTTVVDRPAGRTVVYGVVGRGVDAVDVRARRLVRTAVIGPYGAFIAVVGGHVSITGVALRE